MKEWAKRLIDGFDGLSFTLFRMSFWWPSVPNKPKYFTDEEIKGLDMELVAKLDMARGRAGIPFVITSGRRTEAENSATDGAKNSAHLRGLAVDLKCEDSHSRCLIVMALIQAGFRRLGIYDAHIHCDLDSTLPQPVMWLREGR